MRDDAAVPPDGGPLTAETSLNATEPHHRRSIPSNPSNNATTATSTSTSTTTTPAPPKTPASRAWLSSVRRPRTSPGPKAAPLKSALLSEDDARRDSALASSNSTASTDRATHNAPPSPSSLHKTPSLPTIVVQDDPAAHTGTDSQQASANDLRRDAFQTIDTIIPTGDFDDLTSPGQVSFSKRGSMLLGGKRANKMNKALGLVKEGDAAPRFSEQKEQTQERQERENGQEQDDENSNNNNSNDKEQTPEHNELAPPVAPLPTPRSPSRFSSRRSVNQRALSADEMMLSRKVRSMYKHGNESAAEWDDVETEGGSVKDSVATSSVVNTPINCSSLTVDRSQEDSASLRSSRRTLSIVKEATETAGGVEDWADLEGNEVDRYGFIVPKKTGSRDSNVDGSDGPEEPRIQRVTTALLLVSEEPRRRGLGRSTSRARSARSGGPRSKSPTTQASQKSTKGPRSIFSNHTTTTRSTAQQPLRQAANLLPHNRDRRLLDEASDMLKLPPGLAEVAEQQEGGNMARAMKVKEMEREMKWRKMAKVVRSGATSGGMLFEFDIKDPKVVSRTWKGIPDRWRATAWYSFLAASAEATENSPTEQELIESFYELQEESSADDMQIDVDVPRTINRHIMFRRRYRGGQRLLFRVLHAMSLYLPDTGYVQGMAALTATLLCYYEEDKAFVMLVRLWMLRGLERLYESGFAGLMDALEDFEKNWLRGGDIAKKLHELGITSTSYGTRWYLTLFNYSLPFPAQLRVWDVFMLLGDASHCSSPSPKFIGDLDVLHATSAALIDATREILLDSDFENAMKVLTSWIPVKDEDLLMRVAKAEYKMRKKRANAS